MSRFSYKGGPEMRNDTMFHDIVLDRRIVLAYRMTVGDSPISVSLTTIALMPAGRGTLLRYTEQGAAMYDRSAGLWRRAPGNGVRQPLFRNTDGSCGLC